MTGYEISMMVQGGQGDFNIKPDGAYADYFYNTNSMMTVTVPEGDCILTVCPGGGYIADKIIISDPTAEEDVEYKCPEGLSIFHLPYKITGPIIAYGYFRPRL